MRNSCFILRVFVVGLALMALMRTAYPCSFAIGYFHQVTRLRGTIVGVANGDWRHPFRWLRQYVVRGDITLTLYEYRWPVKNRSELLIVKIARTDKHGRFDFGILPERHYSLGVEAPWGGDWFDVEVTSLSKRIDSVMIDVSPVYPNCKGGHEFFPEKP